MSRNLVARLLVAVGSAIVACATPCAAQPFGPGTLVSVGMFRNGSFTQTGDGASLSTNGYWFSAYATTVPPFEFFQVDLYRPGVPFPELMLPTDPFFTSFGYSTFLLPGQAAMDADFPMGEYVFQAIGPSFDEAFVVYDADYYPLSLPYLSGSNYSAAQGMNATAPFTFEFNPYDPGAGVDESLLFFSLFDTDTNSTAYNAGFLPASTTSLTIPANTLVPGNTYRYELIYSNRKVVDAVGAEFPALLAFDLRTEGTFLASVPEPATLVLFLPATALFGYLILARRCMKPI